MGPDGRRRILERFAFEAGVDACRRFGLDTAPRGRLMRVAFYAPMKPPDHPVPSGDRRMARAFAAAARASATRSSWRARFRSYDRDGRRRPGRRGWSALGLGERRALSAAAGAAEPPDLWFTYHLYHKAPDWLGPR